MADLWANYFEKLVTPLQDNGIYDQFHKNDIENQVNDVIQNSEDITDCIFNVPLTIKEIHEVIIGACLMEKLQGLMESHMNIVNMSEKQWYVQY